MDCQDFYDLKEAYLNIYEEVSNKTHLESTEEMSSDKDKRRARIERKSKDKKKREYEDYNESLDYYDDILSYLIDIGYADTIENAEVIMVNMSEAWIDNILEVTGGGFIPKGDTKYATRSNTGIPVKEIISPARKRRMDYERSFNDDDGESKRGRLKKFGIRSRYSAGSKEQNPNRDGWGSSLSKHGTDSKLSMSPAARAELAARRAERAGQGRRANKIRSRIANFPNNESVDYYDLVLSHLLDEGYADTAETAHVIMANMSEDWVDSILEGRSDRPNSYLGPLIRGQKQKRGGKGYVDSEGNPTGKYLEMLYQKKMAKREAEFEKQRRRDREAMSRGSWDID